MKTIHDYQMLTVTAKPGSHAIMWIFTGEWASLDNFALTPVNVDIGHGMKEYPTSEHAYAAAKAKYPSAAEEIRLESDPGLAKELGRSCVLREEWEQVKFQVMWHVLQAKFDQHPEAVAKLLETGERRIYEGNTWGDNIWGVVSTGKKRYIGRNALGSMLMELREKYRNEPI